MLRWERTQPFSTLRAAAPSRHALACGATHMVERRLQVRAARFARQSVPRAPHRLAMSAQMITDDRAVRVMRGDARLLRDDVVDCDQRVLQPPGLVQGPREIRAAGEIVGVFGDDGAQRGRGLVGMAQKPQQVDERAQIRQVVGRKPNREPKGIQSLGMASARR